jgi:uncharacterized surface protein with fasciclin (FAS1) repeats
MRVTKAPRLVGLASIAVVSALAVGACSSDNKASDTTTSTTAAPSAPTTTATAADASATQTIVDVAAANPDFSTLVSAVKAAGLAETLSGAGPFTVFAPTNAAFDKLPAGTVASLLKPENKQKLADILTYHVVSGKVMAADVTPGKVTTVNGSDFTVAVGDGVTITDGQGSTANVVKTDVTASNGVIHVIDAVLLPPGT